MVLTAACPKCNHEFPLLAPCPCRAVGSLGGAAPAATVPSASPAVPSTMLSLSITAASATSLNGGHVIVNTAAPTPRISVCATLPAPSSASLPWTWQQTTTPTSWTPSSGAPPLWSASAAPASAWTTPSILSPWTAHQPPPPTTLNLQFCPGATPSAPAVRAPPPPTPKGAQYRLTGGGIVHERGDGCSDDAVLLQPRGKLGLLSCGPEQSPSTPLSFVLPASKLTLPVAAHPAGSPAPPLVDPAPELDLALLQATTRALKTSGWYYEGFSWQESAATLRHAPPGTFLVRDSSDPRFLFSLSVQTDRGPTSVRLHYISGGFRLDAEPHLAPTMPQFPCVLRLVEHYVASSRRAKRPPPTANTRGREQVWVDARGQMYSHILLTEPRRHTVPGLQHLARLAVNRQLRAARPSCAQPALDQLVLPTTLRRYLGDYPYTL